MLTCIHGTDSHRIQATIQALTTSACETSKGTATLVSIDCTEDGASEAIERHLKYPSFFGYQTLIIASNAACQLMDDILERYPLASLSDIHCVAVQNTAHKGSDKKTLARLIRNAHTSIECAPRTGNELIEWVSAYCIQRDSIIAPETASLLIRRIGTETSRLAVELDKLCAYAGHAPIDAAAIQLLTSADTERDQWELSNAIAAHDKRTAITALWRSQQEGTPDQLLIGSLAASLRNLLMIHDLVSAKHTPAIIAKRTGLHPFVVSKSLRGAQMVDFDKLKRAHLSLARLDRNSKDGFADTTDELYATLLSL